MKHVAPISSTLLSTISKNKVLFCIFFISFLVLQYRLGHTVLQPWDEAWYADIARNIIRDRNALKLNFNNDPYLSHPPFGFLTIALSYLVLGVGEYSARLPMVLFGAGSVTILYVIGKELVNRYVGVAASLVLFSSRWFLLRARSANLDILLLFLELLVFYYSFKSKTKKEIFFLWLLFSLSLLTKSIIGLTLLPLVLFTTFCFLKKQTNKVWTILQIGLLTSFFVLPWYVYNTYYFGKGFLTFSIFHVGLRDGSSNGIDFSTIDTTLLYLRSGIHRWYQPLFLSLFLTPLLLFIKECRRSIYWILAYLLFSSAPYYVSSTTGVWHLIPTYAPISLLIASVSFYSGDFFMSKLKKIGITNRWGEKLYSYLFVFVFLLISIWSVTEYWGEMWKADNSLNRHVTLLKETKEMDEQLILYDNTYFPTAVFYSERKIFLKDYVREELMPDVYITIVGNESLSNFNNYEIIDEEKGLYLVKVR